MLFQLQIFYCFELREKMIYVSGWIDIQNEAIVTY
jgi:hypothetical protein